MVEKKEKYIVSAVIGLVGGALTYLGSKVDGEKGKKIVETGIVIISTAVISTIAIAELPIKKSVEAISNIGRKILKKDN